MSRIAVIGLVGESVFLTLERHQEVGETAHATDIHREWGGKGYNQAIAAARYGAEVAFLGAACGADADSIARAAAEDGVRAYIAKKDIPTAYGVIATDKSGDNRVTVFGGAALEEADVAGFAAEIEAADALIIGNEVPECVNVAAVKIAVAKGVKVIYNPAPVREICQYLLANTDLFTPNEYEYEALGERDNVIVTLGARGCMIGKEGRVIPALPIERAVDTTGAGDTFTGVLSVALAEGLDEVAAATAASAAASLEVTKKYVMPAIPTRAEVEEALRG